MWEGLPPDLAFKSLCASAKWLQWPQWLAQTKEPRLFNPRAHFRRSPLTHLVSRQPVGSQNKADEPIFLEPDIGVSQGCEILAPFNVMVL